MENSESNSKCLVNPLTLKGFKDLLPEEAYLRNEIIDKIRCVFERFGFQPVDTPILEYLVTLIGTGGEESNKQLFRLESPEKEPIALRFDLTVPFARVLAQYPDQIKLPFRCYHFGPTFRADKPDPGRYRQFTQFDIDAAGSSSVAVDAEIIAAMCEALRELGLRNEGVHEGDTKEYQVSVNNRKLVDALLDDCGIKDNSTVKHILRVIDKLNKAGIENVRKELGAGRMDESGDEINGVNLEEETIDKIINFISIKGDNRAEVISALEKVLPESELAKTAIAEMREIAACLESLGIGEDEAVFDSSLARGLDYYTGPVYEAYLPIVPRLGSVMGGGRYDHLVERFSEDPIEATGASIGIDRLIAALAAAGKTENRKSKTKVLVIGMKGVPANELYAIARDLRINEIATEVFMKSGKSNMKEQLKFANNREIPIAIIIGEDELKNGKASVKDLVAGKEQRSDIDSHKDYKKSGKSGQVTVDRNRLVQTINDILQGC